MIIKGDFTVALAGLRLGGRVKREGWNGKNMFLALQRSDKDSKMTNEYIYIQTSDHQLVPWVASQTDLLSYDWIVLDA